MKKVLVPRVRFKGFGEEWSEERLEEIGQTYTGLSGKTKKDFGHGNSRYITYLNIFNNPISNLKGLDRIEKDCKQNSVKYGDIFVTTSSEIPEEVGMTSIWPFKDKENIYLNSFCFGIRLNNINNYYINFLAYNLRNNELRKDIVLLAQGISRFNISNRRFMKLNILLPNISEQQKIGKLLENIDNLITLEEIKLNKLKQLKETLLQKMFPEGNSKTPKIRFRGFDEEWKEERLDDIFKVITGGEPPKNYKNSKHPVGKYKYPIYSNGQEANAIWGFSDNYSINTEAITISSIGTIGFPVVRKMFFTPIIRLKTLLPYNKNMNINFLNLSVSQINFSFNQAGIPSMNSNQLKDNIILISRNFSEQQKIGDFFSKIDTLINLYNSKLNKLKQIKESLLQKMFV
ncbi:restriction endonuclease subunit S [Mycoplasmopsis felis]|uniref:restriction endonuclease subunit S n=1 Tax=Mycoplasmopsis felis TaxID=33923 RepID=UPI002AFED942|nr:restriction endonuclease subunit S [Mycoplasmopsis felis]WQQ10045.1 restriction endonuclease subunit S [Mycoplasmopsis felis]